MVGIYKTFFLLRNKSSKKWSKDGTRSERLKQETIKPSLIQIKVMKACN